LATDGDVHLGGYDWDLRLLEFVADKFVEAGGPDPRQDPCACGRLYMAVEEAKHTLSVRSRAAVRLDHGGRSLSLDVTREQFEDLTADLLERTLHTTRQVLRDASVSWDAISQVLLVGGSTRMPIVPERLERMSRIRPDRSVNPDEAVARGAALYAGFLLNRRAGRETGFVVSNVNSHSLGVEGIDPDTLRRTNVLLIPRNTPLPATFTDRFTTKRDGQQSIVIQVLEGESSSPDDCTQIGRTVLRGLPPNLPQGTPIDVTFSYQSNGRLEVSTRIPGMERDSHLTIERSSGLSDSKVDDWRRSISISDRFDRMAAMAVSEPADDGATPPPPQAGPASPVEPPEPPQPTARDAQPATPVARFRRLRSDAVYFSARRRSSNLRFWILLAGWILSSVLGLGLGYLLVTWLVPQVGWPRPW
ncbi:MAG: Hsp70 family protein, partial [Thermoguttaceae bacterium]